MTRPHKRRTRTALVAIALTTVTLGLGVVTAGTAAASGTYTGRAYIYGTGYLDGDWADEGVNNVSTHRYSNATCLWQTIGFYEPGGGLRWASYDTRTCS